MRLLIEKWKNHNHMVGKMVEIVKRYGLSAAGKPIEMEGKVLHDDLWKRQGGWRITVQI